MKNIFALLIIAAVFMPACSSSKWVRTSVVKEYDFAVALEYQPVKEAIAPPRQDEAMHPNLAGIQRLLSELQYIEEGRALSKSKQSAVFQPNEVERLSPVLVDALAKAAANQRVRFLSFNQEKEVVFSKSRKTEGVVFIGTDGQLNIAFNYINSNRLPSESSAIHMNFSDVDPVNIRSADRALVATAPYLQLQKLEGGGTAPLWVVADLDNLTQASLPAQTPVAAEITPTGQVSAQTPSAVAPTSTPSDMPEAKAAEDVVRENVLRQDIKNKLKYLKELYEEGLISEKDYMGKKQQLLDMIN